LIYQWTVIGAGPAGIAAIGNLLDQGISPQGIAWIDPAFNVGDFGTIWRRVHGNTKVKYFLKFLEHCQAFQYKNCSEKFSLNTVPIDETCELSLMAEPLQWISNHLKEKVKTFTDFAEKLSLNQRVWTIQLRNNTIFSKQVILAIGAEPKHLSLSHSQIIPLQDVLDKERLLQHIQADDTIGVFGSSHSAVLALRNLVEQSVSRIINFYQEPLRYAVHLKDWILFDNTGLKGPTAEWARIHLDGVLPKNLTRVFSSKETIEKYLPQCTKVIYAVGFERRTFPEVEGLASLTYLEQSGIIAPGLFGVGIAFPEAKTDPLGRMEYRVGLWKFMDYLQNIMPLWLQYTP